MSKSQPGEKNPMYGKHHTVEAKEKIRQARLGSTMPPRSKEYREKISKLHKGKIVSEETRRKLSESCKGRPSPRKGVILSEETKQKLREANLGKKMSEETKRKVSEALQGRPAWNKGKKYKSNKKSDGSNNPNWRGGISFKLYSEIFTEELKESIRKRDGYVCQECGVNQEEMTSFIKKLDIHHIDYDKHNNEPENLISLCRSCHAKTSFTREDWTRYFRNRIQP